MTCTSHLIVFIAQGLKFSLQLQIKFRKFNCKSLIQLSVCIRTRTEGKAYSPEWDHHQYYCPCKSMHLERPMVTRYLLRFFSQTITSQPLCFHSICAKSLPENQVSNQININHINPSIPCIAFAVFDDMLVLLIFEY